MRPKILLIGKNGQIGRELDLALRSFAEVVALGHSELELRRPDEIRRAIRTGRPDLIVNAAAYTAVEQAESDEQMAYDVNAVAPGVMAEEARSIGAMLVHYSTDYVFDGRKRTPYVEEDSPNPTSVYGKTKLAGEQAIQASGAAHLIFRTAWVYSVQGRNFLLSILRAASEREEITVVDDQIGSPTHAREVSSGTVRVLREILKRDATREVCGIYHMTAAGETSWYGFAAAILEKAEQNQAASWLPSAANKFHLKARLVPVSSSLYPSKVERPAYSVLSNARAKERFGLELSTWQAQLQAIFVGN